MCEQTHNNRSRHDFFHATTLEAAERIACEGFKVWRQEPGWPDLAASGGNLGYGIYLSREWRTALMFGCTLLRTTLQAGTRVLDATPLPDAGVIRYLQREFGRAILTEPPSKALPHNKQLKLNELVALFRYHYQRIWEQRPEIATRVRPKFRELHAEMLHRFRGALIRYGFHAYGDPRDENGIVVFAGDRVRLVELVAELPLDFVDDYWEERPPRLSTLAAVRAHFEQRGSHRARSLARLLEERRHRD